MNITITIEAPELVGAINNLAFALETRNLLADSKPADIFKPLETQVPKEDKAEPEKETPKPESKKEPETAPEPEPVKEEPKQQESASSISIDVLTTKTRQFIQGSPSNKENLKNFLNQKQVKKITDLKPADYEEAIQFMEDAAQ